MKAYSGKFVLRLPEDLHKQLVNQAQNQGSSLNQVCLTLLKQGIAENTNQSLWQILAEQKLILLKKHFGKNILGVIAFGSQVSGNATAQSDLDLLIILDKKISLGKKLYEWWDQDISRDSRLEINPHFVHLPQEANQAGGIWFEIALNHKTLYQKTKTIQKYLDSLLVCIQEGKIIRKFSNGHPYWVWSQNEK